MIKMTKIVSLPVINKYFLSGGIYIARVGKEWVYGHSKSGGVNILRELTPGLRIKMTRYQREPVPQLSKVRLPAPLRGISPEEVERAMRLLISK